MVSRVQFYSLSFIQSPTIACHPELVEGYNTPVTKKFIPPWGKMKHFRLLLESISFMHRDYLRFTAADFIADEYFLEWVNHPNGESRVFWDKWVKDHPEKRREIEEATSFINNLHFNTVIPSDKQTELSLKKSLLLIESLERSKKNQPVKASLPGKYIYWMAAVVVIAGMSILFWSSPAQKYVTVEQITGNGEIKTIVLPDSSLVTLNGNSSIKYSTNLNSVENREVWLEGEGFFNIRHIETDHFSKRFIVHSGNLNVEVLGTTFNVKKRASVTNVTLNTGKIKIDLKNDPGSVIYLQPGDFVQYSVTDKHLVKKQVRPELYSVWKEEKFQLDNMPLSEVAQFIHDTYGYLIQLEKNLEDDRISGKLILKNEAALIETLSFVLNINIIKKDSVLIFQSKPKN